MTDTSITHEYKIFLFDRVIPSWIPAPSPVRQWCPPLTKAGSGTCPHSSWTRDGYSTPQVYYSYWASQVGIFLCRHTPQRHHAGQHNTLPGKDFTLGTLPPWCPCLWPTHKRAVRCIWQVVKTMKRARWNYGTKYGHQGWVLLAPVVAAGMELEVWDVVMPQGFWLLGLADLAQ